MKGNCIKAIIGAAAIEGEPSSRCVRYPNKWSDVCSQCWFPIPPSEQTTNAGAASASSPEPARATPAAPASSKPDSGPAREILRVGARVLAAYWNEKREFEGFWLATVKRIEAGEYILEWFDAPGYLPFKSRPQDIAVPHPEFRVTGK